MSPCSSARARILFPCLILGVAAATVLCRVGPAQRPLSSDKGRTFLHRVQQGGHAEEIEAGKFLVASRDLPDPNFAKTVVLVTQYEEEGVVGLIINRQSKLPLSRVLELEEAKDRSDPVYWGGPVERTDVHVLLRTAKPPDAEAVLPGVYRLSSEEGLRDTLRAGTNAKVLRVYLGYAGWGAGQLENEMDLGAWHVFTGNADWVFDPHPESLWSRLIERTELQIAESGFGIHLCGTITPTCAWLSR